MSCHHSMLSSGPRRSPPSLQLLSPFFRAKRAGWREWVGIFAQPRCWLAKACFFSSLVLRVRSRITAKLARYLVPRGLVIEDPIPVLRRSRACVLSSCQTFAARLGQDHGNPHVGSKISELLWQGFTVKLGRVAWAEAFLKPWVHEIKLEELWQPLSFFKNEIPHVRCALC